MVARPPTVLVITTLALYLMVPPARARAPVAAEVPAAVDLIADRAGGHVYVSDGEGGRVTVVSASGSTLAQIDLDATADPDDYAGEMALGNNRVYVVTDGGLAKINAVTQTQVTTLSVPADPESDVAFAGGRVWFVGTDDLMRSVDPVDEADVRVYGSGYPIHPFFASEPSAAPTSLVTLSNQSSPQLEVWDVSAHPPALVGSKDPGVTLESADVNGAGTRVYYSFTSAGEAGVREVALDTVTNLDVYPLADGAIAGPVAATASFVAASTSAGAAPTLSIFPHAAATPVRSVALGSVCGQTMNAGLAFFPSGDDVVTATDGVPSLVRVLSSVTSAGEQAGLSASAQSASFAPGDPIRVTGTLSLPGGGDRSGRGLQVWRSAGAEIVRLHDASTTSGGAFELTDGGVETAGSYCYSFLYAGDVANAGATTRAVVSVERLATSIVGGEVSPRNAAPGDSVTVEGSFSTSDGMGEVGVAVHVLRSHGTGFADVGTVQTGLGGAFSFVDEPPGPGAYRYRVRFPGSARYGPASDVVGATHVEKLAPRLRLRISDGNLSFGRSTTLTARLAPEADRREVALLYRPKGGHRRLLVRRTVPSDGAFALIHTPRANGIYVLTYAGSDRYKDARDESAVTVHADVKAQMLDEYANRKGVALYHVSQSVKVRADLAPKHKNERIRLVWWFRTKTGGWREFSDFRYDLRRGRFAVVAWPDHFFRPGTVARVQASFVDADHALGRSKFLRFKTTP